MACPAGGLPEKRSNPYASANILVEIGARGEPRALFEGAAESTSRRIADVQSDGTQGTTIDDELLGLVVRACMGRSWKVSPGSVTDARSIALGEVWTSSAISRADRVGGVKSSQVLIAKFVNTCCLGSCCWNKVVGSAQLCGC